MESPSAESGLDPAKTPGWNLAWARQHKPELIHELALATCQGKYGFRNELGFVSDHTMQAPGYVYGTYVGRMRISGRIGSRNGSSKTVGQDAWGRDDNGYGSGWDHPAVQGQGRVLLISDLKPYLTSALESFGWILVGHVGEHPNAKPLYRPPEEVCETCKHYVTCLLQRGI